MTDALFVELNKLNNELNLEVKDIIEKQKDLIVNKEKMLNYLNEVQLRLNSGSVSALLEMYVLVKITEDNNIKNILEV